MSNLVDHNGRTIWFKGPPGPMKPASAKSRSKKRTSSKKAEESPKKKEAEGEPLKKLKKKVVKSEMPNEPRRKSGRKK